MTTKEYLQQYRTLDMEINSKLDQLAELREKAEKVSSSGGGSSGGQISDKVGRTAAKIVDLDNEINRDIDRLVNLKREIEAAVGKIPNETYRILLIMRYINGKTFEQIAVDMYYSYKWICILHGRALKAVKEYIEVHT